MVLRPQTYFLQHYSPTVPKAERLGALLNDDDLVTMALPDEEEGYGEWIDADDLDALFAHLAEAHA